MSAAVSGTGSMDKIATKDTTQLDLNYRGSSLNGKTGAISTRLQPGDRAPDALLADGSWLSDTLKGTQWKCLLFTNMAVKSPKHVKAIEARDPAIASAYGLSEGMVLIRPDHHIVLIAHNQAEMDAYFERQF